MTVKPAMRMPDCPLRSRCIIWVAALTSGDRFSALVVSPTPRLCHRSMFSVSRSVSLLVPTAPIRLFSKRPASVAPSIEAPSLMDILAAAALPSGPIPA